MGTYADHGDTEQVFYGPGNFPETVQKLSLHILTFRLTLNARDPLVNIQLLHLIHHIGRGNKSIHIQIHRGGKLLRRTDPLKLLDGIAQHPAVQIIAYRLHMPVLPCSQEISGPPDLQIPHGNPKTASQIGKLLNSGQSLFRNFLKHLVPAVHQKRIGGAVAAPHPAPELIKL